MILLLLSLSSTIVAAELRLGGTEWPPYMGSELKGHGIAAIMVTEIFKRAGHKVRFVFFPWQRTQLYVRDGKLAGLAIAWYTQERTRAMTYSHPYLQTAIVLIKRREDPFVYRRLEDLYGKNIGVIIGYGYLKKIESEKIRKSFVSSLQQNLLKLIRKRIDLTIEEKLNALNVMSQMPDETRRSLAILERPLEVKRLHITISKNIPNADQLLQDFNDALVAMLEDGSYHRLIGNFRHRPLPVDLPLLPPSPESHH